MNNILTKKDPLTLADIEQMDKMQLFETDKERLSPAEQQELTAMNEQIRALNLTPEQKTNLLAVAEGFYKIPETGARPKF
ncbi:MAG: hypothetical protein LBP53_07050 [Candidatus Peribacteria bacterium]|jgi:predicted Mrr-cat superfamily restriction endonuclease|nr:hypothetical protein [Candidatus Peribacteria bacterium]